MATLLILIYLAFISLGLPDSLLGATWPAMHAQLGAPLAAAGYVSMIVSGGTIISSLLSTRLIARFGTGKIMVVSVLTTAIALFAYSLAPSVYVLCLIAVPMGLGAGSVDAALNNFVALHYKASHMSWLHCMWGVGATVGPMIMAACLRGAGGWRAGYRAVSYIQMALVFALLFSLPLWRRARRADEKQSSASDAAFIGNAQALRIAGVPLALITFFCLVGFESTAGVWGASYLMQQKGMAEADAAFWGAMFFAGTTAGRFLSGFIAMRVSGKNMIRAGLSLAFIASLLLALPLPKAVSPIALLLLGVGNAPLYPSMIHETPHRFGASASQAVTGLQMACAYVGSTFLPPLEGLLSNYFSLKLIPYAIFILVILGIVLSEALNRCVRRHAAG